MKPGKVVRRPGPAGSEPTGNIWRNQTTGELANPGNRIQTEHNQIMDGGRSKYGPGVFHDDPEPTPAAGAPTTTAPRIATEPGQVEDRVIDTSEQAQREIQDFDATLSTLQELRKLEQEGSPAEKAEAKKGIMALAKVEYDRPAPRSAITKRLSRYGYGRP